MAETAIERVLHYKCPEWGDSVRSARSEVGFSFELQDDELWKWLVSGGHEKVKEVANREVRKLGVEEFIDYYLCCFYSNYEKPGRIFDLNKIKGPPWVTIKCPVTKFGADWHSSIQNTRESIDHKLGQKDGLASGRITNTFLSWYFQGGGAEEIAELAINEVQRLGMEAVNSLLWVCCLPPEEVYRMVDGSGLLYSRFPQLMDWDRCELKCPKRTLRRRLRAYPGGVDWSEGISRPDSFPNTRPGIHGQVNSDANSRLSLSVSWDPMIAPSSTEVVETVRDLHKYYESHYQTGVLGNAPPLLEKLARRKKGGRSQLGPAQREIALECARLKDEELYTYSKIAKLFKFPMEEDSYGKLTQSSKTRRYVKLGRELRNQ